MKALAVFCSILAVAVASEHCYTNVESACAITATAEDAELRNCNAKYSAFDAMLYDLQAYTNAHISRSWEYLLMSTHFNNYEKNREGFGKLFRKYSDATWNDAIDIIKHIAKRGGKMNFAVHKTALEEKKVEEKKLEEKKEGKKTYEMSEMASLARALDVQKILANEAHRMHAEATRRNEKAHDPEVSQFLEERFIESHADQIRELAGHTNDLKKLIATEKPSLNMFLFDQYLQTL